MQHAAAWAVIMGLPALALCAGLLHQRYTHAALIAGASAIGLYLLLLAVSGAWAASCWECASESDPIMRKSYFTLALIWGAIFTVLLEGTIWLGILISRMLHARLSVE
jgi:hypothetical protein